MSRDTKQSEKDFLRRLGDTAWDFYKPFPPPAGNAELATSLEMIQDFLVMLHALAPTPSDLILDLGAGACWCTDWLQRLNLRVVSVDLARDMLRLGRERLGAGGRAAHLVAGDLEALPFASASFQRACCLSALHHVPSIETALAEIRRVLTPDGAAVFIEPGTGHSQSEQAQAAMRDFGVLEQDVVVHDFMRQCSRAGFGRVRLLPVSYVLPDVTLTLDDWDSWAQPGAHGRERGVASRMAREVLDAVRRRPTARATHDQFATELFRRLRVSAERHPAVLASCSEAETREPRTDDSWLCSITALESPAQVVRTETFPVRVRVENRGVRTWRARPSATEPHVRIGVQLRDESGGVLVRDYFRTDLPCDVPKGHGVEVSIPVPTPAENGRWTIAIDLVAEMVTWFEAKGSSPLLLPIDVQRV